MTKYPYRRQYERGVISIVSIIYNISLSEDTDEKM
jgi:hypothetical protein